MGNTLKKSDEQTLNINNKVKRRLRKRVKTEGIAANSALSPLEKIFHEEMAYPPSISNSHNMMYMQYNEDKEMEDFFDWIPLELISHCLSFLPLKDLFNSALVCKNFYKATSDCLLWKAICERDLCVSQKLETMSWKDYYRMVTCITWDNENCVPNEFKFGDQSKTISKITSYGVATARSKCVFSPEGKRYVFDIKINYRRPNFFYGIGFIDKNISFNFNKAAYPKPENSGDIYDKRFENQWFYWSDGNCWDVLGSHPVNARSRTYISKKGIDRSKDPKETNGGSLAFYSGDTMGIVLDYSTKEGPLLSFILNGVLAHQFTVPKTIEMYLAVYFYNANDSVTIVHCPQDKYDTVLKEKEKDRKSVV